MWKGTVTELFQKHVWCLIIGFFVILVSIATLYYGSDSEAGNNLSLASAIASIILALVAILYAGISGWRSELNVGKMRQLIAEGHRQLNQKMEPMAEGLRRLEMSGTMYGPSPPLTEEPEGAAENQFKQITALISTLLRTLF